MRGYGVSGSERVPAALQGKYDEIVALTDQFCQQHLTEEYRELCRRMVAMLCRKRPSPVVTGKTNTWACGIVYSVGRVNFLFDKSQTPHMRADELCPHFGLSPKTAHDRLAGELARKDHFHRDDSVQAQLAGLVNDAHAAACDFLQELVIAKAANGCLSGCRR